MNWKQGIVGLAAMCTAGCGTTSDDSIGTHQGALETKGRYLVVFKAEAVPSDVETRLKAAGGKLSRRIDGIGVVTAVGSSDFAKKIANDPMVLAAGPERFEALSPRKGDLPEPSLAGHSPGPATTQGFLSPTPADAAWFLQWGVRRVGAPAAWARIPAETQNKVTVAVIDTGVMDDHPDLAGQVVDRVATNYCRSTGGANKSPAYPGYPTFIDFDKYAEWDPEVDPCSSAPIVYEGHGTHVAGTVAAKTGGGATVGVAPGVKIAAYKVFDRYRFTRADGRLVDDVGAFTGPVLEAVVDAAQKGYQVASLSLGGHYDKSNSADNAEYLARDRVMKYADRLGTLVVASAGNANLDLNGTLVHLPSDLPSVVCTSASAVGGWSTTPEGLINVAPGQDAFASYSNYGAAVDLSGPGGDNAPGPYPFHYGYILSTWISVAKNGKPQPGYVWSAGTSMATPHVSAVAALVRAVNPGWTPGDVRSHLKTTSELVGERQLYGIGLVNADNATR